MVRSTLRGCVMIQTVVEQQLQLSCKPGLRWLSKTAGHQSRYSSHSSDLVKVPSNVQSNSLWTSGRLGLVETFDCGESSEWRMIIGQVLLIPCNLDTYWYLSRYHSQRRKMASSLALNNFPGFSKEAIPQDWFPRGEEVTCQIGSYLLALPKCLSHDWVKSQVSTGTTLVAVEFEGGVVIGADSRTSMVRIPPS